MDYHGKVRYRGVTNLREREVKRWLVAGCDECGRGGIKYDSTKFLAKVVRSLAAIPDFCCCWWWNWV